MQKKTETNETRESEVYAFWSAYLAMAKAFNDRNVLNWYKVKQKTLADRGKFVEKVYNYFDGDLENFTSLFSDRNVLQFDRDAKEIYKSCVSYFNSRNKVNREFPWINQKL